MNCAGRTKRTSTLDVPEADWDAILETELTETFRACRVFGRQMIKQHHAQITNIGSLNHQK